MPAVENVEWLNQNAHRSYPIHEDSDMTPTLPTGSAAAGVSLPTCLITDFTFTLSQDEVSEDIRPCLTGVTHAGNSLLVSLGLHSASGTVDLATVTVDKSAHVENTAYKFTGTGEYDDCAGWITIGDIAKAEEDLPEGVYYFPGGQCEFELSCLKLVPRHVRSISVVSGTGLTESRKLYGRVRLVGGKDMTIAADTGNNAVWLSAMSDTGYARTDGCSCGTSTDARVKTVNGINVDSVQIIGTDCVSVSNDGSYIKIGNSCASPCCGDGELQYIVSKLKEIEDHSKEVKSDIDYVLKQVDKLTNPVTEMIDTIRSYPLAFKPSSAVTA